MASGSTISQQIANINASKTTIKNALIAKGVTVPSNATLAQLATIIENIQIGGNMYRHEISIYNPNNSEGDLQLFLSYLSSSSTPITLSTIDTIPTGAVTTIGSTFKYLPIVGFSRLELFAGFIDIRGYGIDYSDNRVLEFRIDDGTTTIYDTVIQV